MKRHVPDQKAAKRATQNLKQKKKKTKKQKAFQDSPKQLRQMHMAQVLMTKLLVDILTADKFFTNSPEKPNRVTQQTQSKHLQVTGNSPPPWQRPNYFPTPIFGYYCCSKFSMYQIYKTQKLPPHCSIKSLGFSYCSSFSNMGDEQQPNYISLSST